MVFKVSTVGFKNIRLTYDTRASATGSKYELVQYTTNGTDYLDYPASSSFSSASAWESRAVDFTGFPGVANNPNFGVRIVVISLQTATYGTINNTNYLGVTSTYGTSGTVSYDIVKFVADAITTANHAPTITSASSQTNADTVLNQVNFTVNDADEGPSALTLSVSSPDSGISGGLSVGGSGSSRYVNIQTSLQNSTNRIAPVVVTVTDSAGDSTVTTFLLTIKPQDTAPTVSGLNYTNTLAGQPITLKFTAVDDITAADSLGYAVTSANSVLLPPANIVTGGSGTNRTLTLTPVAGKIGTAPISVAVTDGSGNVTTLNFALLVRANTNVVFADEFDYTDGTINTTTLGFWKNHSGTLNQLTVTGGVANVSANLSEDCNADLFGQPYSTNSSAVIYYSLKVNFSTLPTEAGSYFAHLLDKTTIGAGAATAFGARLYASTLNAAPGAFRLGVSNGSGSTNGTGQVATDLTTNQTYLVVVRFVPATGLATIWLNPAAETDASVTAADQPTPGTPNNAINVTSIALRENTGEGVLTVDDLRVALNFDSVVDTLKVNQSGANAILTWANPALYLQTATNVAGPYSYVGGSSSPYTNNTATDPARFFRLTPLAPAN